MTQIREPNSEPADDDSSPLDLSPLALTAAEHAALLARVNDSVLRTYGVRPLLGLNRPRALWLSLAALALAALEALLLVRLPDTTKTYDTSESAFARTYEQAVLFGRQPTAEEIYRARFWSKP